MSDSKNVPQQKAVRRVNDVIACTEFGELSSIDTAFLKNIALRVISVVPL